MLTGLDIKCVKLPKLVVLNLENVQCACTLCFFFIRTSNFGAEAERSYIFLGFEAENVLKMFLNYMVYTTCIAVNSNADVTRQPI